MTLERLASILDAHGAEPARWPAAERADALALVGRSAEARALVDAAARLDHVLDALPQPPPPSAALQARIAAAAPARPPRSRVVVALVPLAAAAALALWLVGPEGPTAVPTQHGTVPMARLGVYETPTDSLLALDELDPADGTPAFDCPESGPGCPEPLGDPTPTLTRDERRLHA